MELNRWRPARCGYSVAYRPRIVAGVDDGEESDRGSGGVDPWAIIRVLCSTLCLCASLFRSGVGCGASRAWACLFGVGGVC